MAVTQPRRPANATGRSVVARLLLTQRELRVLRLLSSDLSQRDIGRELSVSHNTIHSHIESIYRKLGVSSRVAGLQRARELGLL